MRLFASTPCRRPSRSFLFRVLARRCVSYWAGPAKYGAPSRERISWSLFAFRSNSNRTCSLIDGRCKGRKVGGSAAVLGGPGCPAPRTAQEAGRRLLGPPSSAAPVALRRGRRMARREGCSGRRPRRPWLPRSEDGAGSGEMVAQAAVLGGPGCPAPRTAQGAERWLLRPPSSAALVAPLRGRRGGRPEHSKAEDGGGEVTK